MKRKSTSTLHEAEDSPDDDNEPSSNLKTTTVQVEVIPSSQEGAKKKTDNTHMECDVDENSPKDSQQEMLVEDVKSSSKTVLISKCQAATSPKGQVDDMDDETDAISPVEDEKMVNGYAELRDTNNHIKTKEPPVPLIEMKETEKASEEKTPEVRIHPATPEVLAAHQMHPKRSVITLTLRPRNPSESSSCGTPDSRVRTISRTPSSCSTSSITSNPITNGIDQLYQNDVDDRDECASTPEIRITPLPKSFDTPNCLVPARLSTRSTNTNKTPSFVVINTPTASPRPPRLKTTVTNGYNGSPRPYPQQRPSVKPRDPSTESFRGSQRSVGTRKENGAATKQPPVSNGKNYASTTVNYCGPVKTSQNGLGSKYNGRYDRGENVKYSKDLKCDKRDSRYDREDKYDREHRYERESRYERELKYDAEPRFERELSYEKDFRYERNSRSEREYNGKHERENGFDSVHKYERDSWCSRDFKYDRGESSRYERDLAYEDDLKFETEFMYNRAESRFDIQYKYDKDSVNGRSCEIVDHCPKKEYPSVLNNTATTPPVITESSV